MSLLDAAVHGVQKRILTQMDGRDLARCQATEKRCQVDVYCVSQEKGAQYRPDRHFDANFNRRSFIRDLERHYPDTHFDQIVLDYFWIPTGWDRNHWNRSFFADTLPGFARSRLLKMVSTTPQNLNNIFPRGVVYLPFCLHCFKEVLACFDHLKEFYNVAFLRTKDLEQISLWSGTQTIDTDTMQNVFGKHKQQENKYCTFTLQHIKSIGDDPTISKAELIRIASSLEDFRDIRFLSLTLIPTMSTPLRCNRNNDCGRILGLTDPAIVKRGIGSDRVCVTPTKRCRETIGKVIDESVQLSFKQPLRTSPRLKKRRNPSPRQVIGIPLDEPDVAPPTKRILYAK